jgi:hypothetical protein
MSTRWPTLRIMLTAHFTWAMVMWLTMMVGSTIISGVAAGFSRVDESIWHYVATIAMPWIALSFGIDAVNTYLRLHLAHGRTRADYLRQLLPYFLVIAGILAALATLGYLIEGGIYTLGGWAHSVPRVGMIHGDTDVLGIFFGFLVSVLPWAVGAAFLGIAFTRNILLGLVATPLALLLVAPGELLVGFSSFPVFQLLNDGLGLGSGAVVLIALGEITLACVAIWAVLRAVTLRPRAA